MQNIIIENLKYEELEEYKALIDDCFESSTDIENYRNMYSKEKNYEIIVAKFDGEIVGSITILKIDLFTFSFQPMLELFNVCVSSKHREKKIGTLLIDFLVDYAKKNGYKCINLTCLDNLPNIHKFYEKVGFEKANSRKYAMYI